MIQQIGVMLAGILAKRRAGDLAGAEAELREKALQNVGLPLTAVKHSPPEAVQALLAETGAMQPLRTVLLAELLIEDGNLAEARGNPPEAVLSLQLASRLLEDVVDVLPRDDAQTYRARLEDLAARLRDLGGGAA
jgi:hypothetical protein